MTSNSFNICPRCGNSNSLNAKYCSRCGAQLKVPEEAVVCPKCHTRNSSLANFCRNCGATLKVGAQTKICPRCGKEINADDNICACGYSFVTLQQTEPKRVNVESTNKKDKKRDKKHQEQLPVVQQQQATNSSKKKKPVYSKKGGRGFAIFAMLLLAVFCYLVIAPATARPAFLVKFDKGFYNYVEDSSGEATPPAADDGTDVTTPDDGTTTDPSGSGEDTDPTPPTGSGNEGEGGDTEPTPPTGGTEGDGSGDNTGDNTGGNENTSGDTHYMYGYSCIAEIIRVAKEFKANPDLVNAQMFSYIMESVGSAIFFMIALVALFIITAAFHLVVCIIRIISQRRSKNMNILFLILAIVTTLLVTVMVCSKYLPESNETFATIKEFFTPLHDGHAGSYGYALFVIPVYYWVFWLYSCLAKAKKLKEKTA